MACCIHGGHCVMANPNRRKRRKNTVWRGLLRLFFLLLLLSLLAAYISNQVAISSRRAELQTLNEQIAQQKTQNEEMERILSRIEGAGELHLMLTLESGGERILAEDAEEVSGGSPEAPERESRRETVILSTGGGEEVVVTRRESPAYRGALVVCQGADRAEVKLAVTQAVAALTGLGADRITVVKCQ